MGEKIKKIKKASSAEFSIETKRFSDVETKILDAFLLVCQEDGIESATLQRVASKAKVAFSTVRYYFAGSEKLTLYDAACVYVVQRAYLYIDAHLQSLRLKNPRIHLLLEYLRVMMGWVKEESEASSYLIYFYYLSAIKRPQIFSIQRLNEGALRRVQSLLFESIGNGTQRQIVVSKELAAEIHQIIFGACVMSAVAKNHDEQLKLAESSLLKVLESKNSQKIEKEMGRTLSV